MAEITTNLPSMTIDVITGITSSAPNGVAYIPAGSAIKIFPTSAGTASVYSTNSMPNNANLDIAAGNSAITSSTNASWDLWSAGAVSAKTVQAALVPLTAVAVVVTSGTWTLEVTKKGA